MYLRAGQDIAYASRLEFDNGRNGDPDQTDLLPGVSGLQEITDRLDSLDDVAITRFSNDDVVRYPLVSTILGIV